jgi:hypothetical protein
MRNPSPLLMGVVIFGAIFRVKVALVALSLVFLLDVSLGAAEIITAAPGERIEGLIVMEGDRSQEISLEVPDSVSEWCLMPSDTPSQKQIALTVRASSPWMITVSLSRPDCRMAEYDLAASEYAPSGMMLEHPLRVWVKLGPDGSQMVELSQDGGMIDGGMTGDDGQEVQLILSQLVSWNDEPLPYGHVYRIDLIFSAVPAG